MSARPAAARLPCDPAADTHARPPRRQTAAESEIRRVLQRHDLAKREQPLDVGETATAVHAGAFHSLVTTSTGRLLAFGDNSYGQLGSARQQGFMHSLMQEAQAGVRELDEDAFETELAHAASVGGWIL